MILSVLVDKDPKAVKFMSMIQVKQAALPLPVFNLFIKQFDCVDKILYIMHFHWKIFRPALVSVIPFGAAVIFKAWIPFWIGVGLLGTEIFMTDVFVYAVFRLGLKKGGFAGSARYCPGWKSLQLICKNGTR